MGSPSTEVPGAVTEVTIEVGFPQVFWYFTCDSGQFDGYAKWGDGEQMTALFSHENGSASAIKILGPKPFGGFRLVENSTVQFFPNMTIFLEAGFGNPPTAVGPIGGRLPWALDSRRTFDLETGDIWHGPGTPGTIPSSGPNEDLAALFVDRMGENVEGYFFEFMKEVNQDGNFADVERAWYPSRFPTADLARRGRIFRSMPYTWWETALVPPGPIPLSGVFGIANDPPEVDPATVPWIYPPPFYTDPHTFSQWRIIHADFRDVLAAGAVDSSGELIGWTGHWKLVMGPTLPRAAYWIELSHDGSCWPPLDADRIHSYPC